METLRAAQSESRPESQRPEFQTLESQPQLLQLAPCPPARLPFESPQDAPQRPAFPIFG
jgi:hypothetical protein